MNALTGLVNVALILIAVLVVIVFFASLRMCSEWQRKVVLRLGRFAGVRGPGIFFLLPFLGQVTLGQFEQKSLKLGISSEELPIITSIVPGSTTKAMARS